MATVDSLEIELKSNAKDVAKGFDTLSNSVKNLSKVDTKNLNTNLKNISKSIKMFVNDIGRIDTTNLEKTNRIMENIATSASKGMKEATNSVNAMNKSFSNTSGIAKSQQALDKYQKTITNIAKTPMQAKFLYPDLDKQDKGKTSLADFQEYLKEQGYTGSMKAFAILPAYKEWQKQMQGLTQQAKEFQSQFNPSKLMKGAVYTDEYKKLSKDILRAEKELQRYYETQSKLQSNSKVSENSQRYKNVEINIQHATNKLQGLYKEMSNLQAMGKDVINPNQFDKVSDGASKAQGVMLSLSKALRAGGFGSAASTVQKLGADVGSLSGGMSQLGATAEGASGAMAGMSAAIPIIGLILAAVTLLIKAFTSLAKAVINVMKKIGSAIKGTVVKIKELISNILSIGTSGHQAHTVLGKFINKIVGLFKSRVLRQAITQAIQYIKDGFKALDAYSQSIGTPFHNNVVMIISDLKWLGKTIAAAFEPIINVAAPILDFLIDKLVTVINYINQFISALTGSSTWTKATKGASGYEEATGGAAKAQKDLNKQIREWDKLNVITDPNKNKGGGGSGGASGDSGGFTTEEVSNNIKNLAKKFKETWENGADFTWLGTDLGNKLAEALDKIPWDNIKESASKLGKALATTINGFVEVPGLPEKLGHAIAEGINTLLSGFEGFVGNIHGDSIGTFIGNLVKTALADIEWDKYITSMGKLGEQLAKTINALANTDVLSEISKSFAKVLKGAIEGAYKFITTIDFKNLGKKIGTSISDFFKEMNEVDESGLTGFQKLGQTISGLATGIMNMLSSALDSINWNDVGKSVIDFLTSIDWITLFTSAAELKSKINGAIAQLLMLAIKGIGAINIDIAIDIVAKAQEAWTKFTTWWADKKADLEIKLPKWGGENGLKSKIESLASDIKSILKATFSISAPKWDKIKSGFESLQSKIKQLLTLNFSIKVDAKAQKITTSVTGGAVSNAVKKAVSATKKKKKANGGIYAHGTWKNIPKYAEGGFPTHGSAFIAGESGAELVGHINGHTEVLNQSQIAKVMASSMSTANAEQNAILKQQNELLLQILQKETGISYKDVFKATQQGAREYKTINGVPAFT